MLHPTRRNFTRRGHRMIADLERVLTQVNRPLSSFQPMLDMASGAGCTVRWLAKRFPQARLYAADNHAPSIAWLKRRFPEVKATLNQTVPPLPYETDAVGLSFAFSLFSHLSGRTTNSGLRS